MSFLRPAILSLLLLGCESAGLSSTRDAGTEAEAGTDAEAEAGTDAVAVADAAADAAAVADAAADAGSDRPLLGSIGFTTFIYAERGRRDRIGEVRPGTSVPLLADEPIEVPPGRYNGCKSGRFYAVAPRGYICEDETTTRDLDAPLYKALAYAAPREGARPYDYAFSTAAPMYGRLPSPKEQQKSERRLRPIADLVNVRQSTDGHEDLAELSPPSPKDKSPAFFPPGKEGPIPVGRKGGAVVRKQIPYGAMLSFSHAFTAEDRTFLLSPDLTLIPADRVRPYRPTSFRGIAISEATSLPIGWIRKTARVKFRKDEQGKLVETGEKFSPRTFVPLTKNTIEQGGEPFLETREPGIYVKAREISVVEEPAELPSGVAPDEKWIDVSLSQGTFTLFEGKRAIYSTLMSPGAGGTTGSAKLSTEELVRGAFTPLGSYRIAEKYRTAQLTDEATPDPSAFWIADVPWVQYFRHPFAIHAAYWHEDFGVPKSGGCINLSPEDALYVFGWTNPRLPEGWAAIEARKSDPGTMIVIRR